MWRVMTSLAVLADLAELEEKLPKLRLGVARGRAVELAGARGRERARAVDIVEGAGDEVEGVAEDGQANIYVNDRRPRGVLVPPREKRERGLERAMAYPPALSSSLYLPHCTHSYPLT